MKVIKLHRYMFFLAVILVAVTSCRPDDTKRRELELVKENFWISPEVVITNDWRFVLNEHKLMRRYIDSIESPDLKKDLAERIVRRWREIDLGKISSSRYVIAADNYFKCIDFLLEDIQDAGVEVDSLTSNLNALLEKYRQMTMDDAELNSKAWGSEREKKFALRLLKKDYEENIRFFESKISPYYRKK